MPAGREREGLARTLAMPWPRSASLAPARHIRTNPMTQHYLRSAAYRDFSIHSIYAMSDDEILAMFARLRWGSDTHQACPACGA